ncbi:MAG TPA: patatin-like phospholipase family protein [Clostridia bacterium]|nr:patatin-like phospholipase family protein [Clostridia bacterium]
MRRGLVLEGGGAKGAYHVGAVKALYDNGYTFDGVAGTSIGAINGAIIAQENNYETCLDMWTNLKASDILNDDSSETSKIFNKNNDEHKSLKYWIERTIAIVKNLGVPTDKIIPFLKRYIDEDKLRLTGRDFAIVTVCISDKKPLELHLEDIPYGELCDYIFASAYFPIFKMERIKGKYYIDGGIYDNLPINALIRKDKYDEIIAIRTGSRKIRPLIDPTVTVKTIQPSESLGKTTILDSEQIIYNIRLGYYDALKMINNYKGKKYYFEMLDYSKIDDLLSGLSDNAIEQIIELYKLKNIDKQEVLKTIYYQCKKVKITTISKEENFLAFLEILALDFGIDRFTIYRIEDFFNQLKQIDLKKSVNQGKTTKANKLFEIIINDIKVGEEK